MGRGGGGSSHFSHRFIEIGGERGKTNSSEKVRKDNTEIFVSR